VAVKVADLPLITMGSNSKYHRLKIRRALIVRNDAGIAPELLYLDLEAISGSLITNSGVVD
jgi:hypothetical protein